MAKANLEMPGGVTVKIEGTPEEISAVLRDAKIKASSDAGRKPKTKAKSGRVTLPGLLEELRNEGFFKKAKPMNDIKQRLADLGHSYPLTALSGPLRGEVRNRRLRRFKEGGKYVYAQ